MPEYYQDEVVGAFKQGLTEAMEEDFATLTDAKMALLKEKAKRTDSLSELVKDVRQVDDDEEVGDEVGEIVVDEEERREDEIARLLDRLEEADVPDDLREAIREHLDAEAVAKSYGARSADPYLASQLQTGREVLDRQRARAEKRQDQLAEAVVEEATDDSILDHTVYADEDF